MFWFDHEEAFQQVSKLMRGRADRRKLLERANIV